MKISINVNSLDDYRLFLKIKTLPKYRICGRTAEFPDEYAHLLDAESRTAAVSNYQSWSGLFDYQQAIAEMAIRKRKFAVFADCGLGKTFILTEFARHAASVMPLGQACLIVSPLMVIPQTVSEVERFYGGSLKIEVVKSGQLGSWLTGGDGRIGITNYEALRESVPQGRIGCLIADESSMLKSHYGKYGAEVIRLGKGLIWKLAATGTPAPNDRIEYANHGVFLDAFPNVNSFLAKFFVNRGQTNERWEMKPHALGPFYRALSHWCIFLSNPATYGWKDNCEPLPPINIHIHDVELTDAQNDAVGKETNALFATNFGGITSRATLARIAKGRHRGEDVATLKPQFIRDLTASWPDESTLIWCKYNDEQDGLAKLFPDAANIDGDTPQDARVGLIDDFKSGRRRVLISKPKILGFGLNLHKATRQIFSTCQDSYEEFYQAVKRSNRYGSTKPLNVHIPVTELEMPMVETVLRKAGRIQRDTEEQERLFRSEGILA